MRYYERVGLLSPARRAANGYRVFDLSALDELAFISRAKGIGMSLDDIAQLVAAWPGGDCRSLQAHLRQFVVERIARVHGQLHELGSFQRQLRSVLERLAARDPGPEACGDGCGCDTDLDVTAGGLASSRPWGCSLGDEDIAGRVGQWRAVASAATSVTRTGETARLVYPMAPETIGRLADLCAAEVGCCPQAVFLIECRAGEITLTMDAPGHPGLLDALVGLDPPPVPGRDWTDGADRRSAREKRGHAASLPFQR